MYILSAAGRGVKHLRHRSAIRHRRPESSSGMCDDGGTGKGKVLLTTIIEALG